MGVYCVYLEFPTCIYMRYNVLYGEEWMSECLFGSYPRFGINCQHSLHLKVKLAHQPAQVRVAAKAELRYVAYQIYTFITDVIPIRAGETVTTLHNVSQHLHLLSVIKWCRATNHCIQDYTTSPHVYGESIARCTRVHRRIQHLRREIARSS